MAGGGFYNYEKHSYPYSPEGKAGFNAAFLWGMDYGLWALELDLLFTGDHLKVYVQNYDYKLTGTLIQIPVLFKLDFHLGRILLQPLAGVNLNFALGKIKSDFGEASYEPPLLGFTFGGVAGFRLGKGHILADLRYTSNLGDTKVNGGTETFERSAFMVFFGFQHYF
jgi:hypothetical protein